jgi:hypothetical protein
MRDNPLAWLALGFAAGYLVVRAAPAKKCIAQSAQRSDALPETTSSGSNPAGVLLRMNEACRDSAWLLEPMAQGYIPSPHELVKFARK